MIPVVVLTKYCHPRAMSWTHSETSESCWLAVSGIFLNGWQHSMVMCMIKQQVLEGPCQGRGVDSVTR